MKKGIIVEHKLRYTIVMDKNGVFHKAIPMKEKEIGMETFYQLKKTFWQSIFFFFKKGIFTWKTIPMVLVCLLLLSPLYLWVLDNNKAYAIVSLDINPSLNITIDRKYQVINVEPINEDAEKLLDDLDVNNQTLTTLIGKIVEKVTSNSDESDNRPILLALSYYKDKHDKQLQDELENYYQQSGYNVAIYEVSEELRTRAETEHASMNELTAEALEQSNDTGVSHVSTDNQSLPISLNNKEKEIIINYYHHKKEAKQKAVENSDVESQEVSNQEQQPPASLPNNTNDHAKEQSFINHHNKEENSGKNDDDSSKQKKDKQVQGQKSKENKNKNHGQEVSEEARSNKGNHSEKVSNEEKKQQKQMEKEQKKEEKEKKKLEKEQEKAEKKQKQSQKQEEKKQKKAQHHKEKNNQKDKSAHK